MTIGCKMHSNTQLIKRCRVCGDQAICFNFEVLTCAPCRMFFNRNVNKTQNWKSCIFNCEIMSTNRRFCRKCRMDKCVAIGMKPKQRQNSDSNNLLNKNIEMALRSVLECEDIQNGSNEISLPQSVSKKYFELNQTEMKYIDELLQSSSSIFNFEEENLPVLYEASSLYQVINTGMHYVRRIIKFCKSNSVFRSLSEQEQYKVLRKFVKKFLKIRHAFAYDGQIEGFYALGSEDGNCSVLNKASYHTSNQTIQQMVERQRKGLIILNKEMENDKTIRDLLVVQALFGSNNKISSLECIRYHYWIYNHLLLRYLQCKYKNMEQAQYKHSMLIKSVHCHNDAKIVRPKVLHCLDRNQFDELAVEILNI